MDVYRNLLPSTSQYVGPIIRKYRPNNQDAPLDFSLKKQETDEGNNNDELSGPFPPDYFGRVFSEADARPFGKNDVFRPRPRTDSDQIPLSLRFQSYRSMTGSSVCYSPSMDLDGPAFDSVQTQSKKGSKRKTKMLRPHELTKKLIDEPVHHPEFPDSVLEGLQQIPTRIDASYCGVSPIRSGWPVLDVNRYILARESSSLYPSPPFLNGLSDLSQFPVRLSAIGRDLPSVSGLSTPVRGLSPTRNARCSPEGMDYRPEKFFPSRSGPPSPKRHTSPKRNGVSSPKKDSFPKRNASPGDDIHLSRDSLSSANKESENCESPQDIAQSSSNIDSIISSQNDQSSQDETNEQAASTEKDQDDSNLTLQNLLTVKTDQFSPDTCQFSPDGTGSDQSRSSQMSPMGQVDSSSGNLFAKRKKGNPVPESQKNEAYVLKRMKNNVAAKKSREKRREHEQMLTKKAQELVTANQNLKLMNKALVVQLNESRMIEKEAQALRILAENRLKDLKTIIADCSRCTDFFYG